MGNSTTTQKRIQQDWDLFRTLVINADANPHELARLQRAFYTGAACVLKVLDEVGSSESDEEDGVRTLAGLVEELGDYVRKLQEGAA